MDAPPWAAPHLRPGERVLWWGRPSRWGLVGVAASTAAAIAFTFFGFESALTGDGGAGAAFGGGALVAAFGLGREFLKRFVRVVFAAYAVTDQRFYAVTSFLSTSVQSIPLSRLSRVHLHQGVVERLFGLWSAEITAYGEAGARLTIPSMRDGERLLHETSAGLLRGANAGWLLRGD